MSYCILQSPKSKEFLEITGTYSYNFTNVEKDRSFACRNHNAFLNMMEGAISGKTGYTGRAGYCYVGALERDGRYLVVALLNTGAYGSGNKGRKWEDTRKLMNYGLEHFKEKTIYEGQTVTKPVMVLNAKPELGKYFENSRIETTVAGDEPITILLADWENVTFCIEQEEEIPAPVRVGQPVGKVEVSLNGTAIRYFDIVCTKNLEEKTFYDTLSYIFHFFLIKN